MSISVNMWSASCGELKRFLEYFYESKVEIDKENRSWFCEYANPLESADIISAVMDNNHKFDITMYIQVGSEELYRVTEENFNDVIKGLFILYYREECS